MDGDEIEVLSADVERARGNAQRRNAGSPGTSPTGIDLDEPRRQAAHDGEADPAVRPVWSGRDDVGPRLDDAASE